MNHQSKLLQGGVSHSKLVKAACRWLRGSNRCEVVLPEFHTMSTEHEKPDVIGWHASTTGAHSILVECKASRADFLADRKKRVRVHPETGMGSFRWMFTPPGIVWSRDELPSGWGLAEWNGKQTVRRVYQAARVNALALHHEVSLLVQSIRRDDSGTKIAKWGSKRFRGDAAPLEKVIPCRGAPHCPGCSFCLARTAPPAVRGHCDHGGGEGLCPYCGEDVPARLDHDEKVGA